MRTCVVEARRTTLCTRVDFGESQYSSSLEYWDHAERSQSTEFPWSTQRHKSGSFSTDFHGLFVFGDGLGRRARV